MTNFVNNSVLHSLVHLKDLDQVKIFLRQFKSCRDDKNGAGETALFLSLKECCDYEIIAALVEGGCNVNIPNNIGITPLHLAVERNDCSVLNLLIQKGATLNAKDKRQCVTALHIAVLQQRLDVLQILLKLPKNGGDRQNRFGETPLLLSLKNNCSDDIISILIDSGCNVNIPDKMSFAPLHFAVSKSSERITQKLIENLANVNIKDGSGDTPLHTAIKYNRIANVQELLKHPKTRCNERNNLDLTPLDLSLRIDNDEITLALLNHGCDYNILDEQRQTILHLAVERNASVIAHELIKIGSDINAIDADGMTPLHVAVLQGKIENVYMLLYYNADANQKDFDGMTPLRLALCNVHKDMHDRRRSKIYKRIRHYSTHFDLELNLPNVNYNIADYLIYYATDLNERNHEGLTPLHESLKEGSDLAWTMIENGADVNLKYDGRHCIAYALSEEYNSSLFEYIWSLADVKILLDSTYYNDIHTEISLLESLITNTCWSAEDFVKCFCIVFKSPYINDFIEQYKFRNTFDSLIAETFNKRRHFTRRDELQLMSLFIRHNTPITFHDICTLYKKYGFDELLEMILMKGCIISVGTTKPVNFTVAKICYNDFDIYLKYRVYYNIEDNYSEEKQNFSKFFKVQFYDHKRYPCVNRASYFVAEVPSLIQLSRDTVRDVMYSIWCTSNSFNVYQALSKLPVPRIVRDILFLKEPIYNVDVIDT